jgi:hypothetical protein
MLGSQQPRIRVVPPYVTSAGVEAIEVARLAGLDLDPWQELTLMDACGQRPDGKWSAFEVGVNVARQNGKGTIQEARELAGAFSFGERLLIHSAHEQITSSEHFRRLLDLIEGVPEFEQRVLKVVRGKGSEAIELRGGQRILFKTRTHTGGRGLTGDYVGLDEAMILPAAVTGVLVPTMAARSLRGNPQLWYCGSQVDQMKHEHGIVFARLRERALSGAERVMYAEWSADLKAWLEARGLPFDPERPEIDQVTAEFLDDQEEWARANPGLGIWISLEHIANERGGALDSRSFATERLGVPDPPDTSEDADRVIHQDLIAKAREHDSSKRIVSPYTYSPDVNWDRTWGAISVGGIRQDGLAQGAVIDHRRGTGWIVNRCFELLDESPDALFVVDARGPAAPLIAEMEERGLPLLLASADDYGNACASFVSAVEDGEFKFPAPQPEFESAVAMGRKQKLGDRWKWSRASSTGADITPLVSMTLAHWGAKTRPPEKTPARAIDLSAV